MLLLTYNASLESDRYEIVTGRVLRRAFLSVGGGPAAALRGAALDRVHGGAGGVGAAGWGSPFQDAGFGLLEVPALGLFGAVVVAAEGREVAFAGAAALVPGGGVVQVASGCGAAAAGRGARGVAGADQVLEGAAGVVADLAVGVVAGTAGDGGQRGGEDPGGPVPGVWCRVVRCRVVRCRVGGWRPGRQAWAAAVPSGFRAVMHQRVRGCRAAAAARSRASSPSRGRTRRLRRGCRSGLARWSGGW